MSDRANDWAGTWKMRVSRPTSRFSNARGGMLICATYESVGSANLLYMPMAMDGGAPVAAMARARDAHLAAGARQGRSSTVGCEPVANAQAQRFGPGTKGHGSALRELQLEAGEEPSELEDGADGQQ
eukprot:3176236-Heterocapsa_arctica.AAC.1